MQEKAYRTLLLWLIWASMALGVYMALYIDTNLWDFMQHDPSKITWLIMGLFALGVVISFGLTMALTQEAVRSVYLGNIGDFPRMNEVYAGFFGEIKPARTTIQAAALPLGISVEIEAVAVDPHSRIQITRYQG